MHFKIKKGLSVPIQGSASGPIQALPPSTFRGLDLSSFQNLRLKLLVQEGEKIKASQVIVEEKGGGGRRFLAPCTGELKEVRRGEKRSLNTLVFSSEADDLVEFPRFCFETSSAESFNDYLLQTGLLSLFRMRPFDLPAHPHLRPRSIFIKALESAPFAPPADFQISEKKEEFQVGLDALSSFVGKPPFLICRENSLFCSMQNASIHTIEGPHPASNLSYAIQKLDPIQHNTEIIWTIDAWGVLCLGYALCHHVQYQNRVVAIAGPSIFPEKRCFVNVMEGVEISHILQGRLKEEPSRILSGDPLMGKEVSLQGFLGFGAQVCCAIPEEKERTPFHFCRMNSKTWTATRAYLSHFLKWAPSLFSTRLYGEPRPFIEPAIYDSVFPFAVPLVPFIKAILANDLDLAEELGLLKVAPEDFSLPTFVCPSKIEMVELVEKALHQRSHELSFTS